MIQNERQYRITKAQADKFDKALAQLMASPQTNDLSPILRKAQEDSLRSVRDELRMQLEEYDALRSGKQKVITVDSFSELPRALIQARIAARLSQKQLAERLGLKEQQIQQYEATEYSSASFARIQEILQALGVHVSLRIAS
ncbi:MAG TPA: helix-turn-helix transcriptional regulator [Chthonomonadaceae bacterium]|nr:helix-turn-helix transcriptional regulator [Chthonomonadaceae bacterium]